MPWEMYKSAFGFRIRTPDPNGKHFLYVSKVKRNGTYEYSTDHTYAKDMTEKTALKHMNILNKEV